MTAPASTQTATNFADMWESIAHAIPDAPALVHGTDARSWREFDARANSLAAAFVQAGLGHQDKVAQYLYNSNEYLESVFAASKASLVPVNTNYRYGPTELAYLWENSDAACVVFHGAFTETVGRVRASGSRVKLWVWVDDRTGPCPTWATPFELLATGRTEQFVPPGGRSGDDLLLLYTGGTTGLPKGVMWRQADLCQALGQLGYGAHAADVPAIEPGPAWLPSSPLMHGTGGFTAYQGLFQAGTVVTLTSRSFDVIELLDAVAHNRVVNLGIVGDTFAKPIIRALEAEPDRWDLSSLDLVASSGTMWSEAVKARLIELLPDVTLSDSFSSSESLRMGVSISGKAATAATARFQPVSTARVIADDGSDVVAGSGVAGRVAVTGLLPIGYYNDPVKTAATFFELDGIGYSMPGDYATVAADGTLELLGRGSACINTGGEKVYPEEVEEVLKEHPAVQDAAVLGVPDEKFGEAVVAVVQDTPGQEASDAEVTAHVKLRLASYKAPKLILRVDQIARSNNGKVDYKSIRALVTEQRSAS